MWIAACKWRAVLAGTATRKMRHRRPVQPSSESSPVHAKHSDQVNSGEARYAEPVTVLLYPNGHAKPPSAVQRIGRCGLIQ